MQEVLFVVKCFVVTALMIVGLQIRVGHQTAERTVMSWIHHSSVSHTLQDVAEGAVKFGQAGQKKFLDLVGSNQTAEEPTATEASTGGWFKIKRSAAYQRQKEREQKDRAKADEQARLNEGTDSGLESSVERD